MGIKYASYESPPLKGVRTGRRALTDTEGTFEKREQYSLSAVSLKSSEFSIVFQGMPSLTERNAPAGRLVPLRQEQHSQPIQPKMFLSQKQFMKNVSPLAHRSNATGAATRGQRMNSCSFDYLGHFRAVSLPREHRGSLFRTHVGF